MAPGQQAPGQSRLQGGIHKFPHRDQATSCGILEWTQNRFVEGLTQIVTGCLLTYKEPDGGRGDSLFIGISWFEISVGTALPGSRTNVNTPLGGPS